MKNTERKAPQEEDYTEQKSLVNMHGPNRDRKKCLVTTET